MAVASADPETAADVEAAALVRSHPDEVFAFLSDLRNHWRMTGRGVKVVTIEADQDGETRGGVVRIRGPLGMRRTAATRVVAMREPHLLIGTAEIGPRTRARVSWT